MIFISPRAFDAVLAACRAACPEEACGLLLGRDNEIREAVPCRNAARDRLSAFQIEPAQHLCVQREARGRGLDVLGAFHSHPGGAAAPSARDARELPEGDLLWLICAVGPGKAPVARLFSRQPRKSGASPAPFVEEALQIRKAVA